MRTQPDGTLTKMTSSHVFFLLVLLTLVASGQSTTCDRCWNVGNTECCNDQTMECPDSTCMTISEYCILDGKEYRTIRKTCGGNTTCDICFSVSTEQGITVLASTQCGTGDNSNSDLDYKITCKALEMENGYSCPACYKNDSMEGCDAGDKKVRCRGAETECVDYAGRVQLSDGDMKFVSAKGCIMQNGCKFGFAALPGAREMERKKFDCTPANKE